MVTRVDTQSVMLGYFLGIDLKECTSSKDLSLWIGIKISQQRPVLN
jgi:hypothetical protein